MLLPDIDIDLIHIILAHCCVLVPIAHLSHLVLFMCTLKENLSFERKVTRIYM